MESTPPTDPVTLPDGRRLSVGQEVTIRGVRGRFTFRYVRNGELTFFGGQTGRRQWRTFTAEQVAVIHRPPRPT